ncbi:MAG: hypothetical protein IKZ98_14095 [Clostridia bacterium]|nr:hypothetical protein [Clostridia bacterium]
MKKITALLSIVMILLTSVALAQGPATPTDIRATPTNLRASQDTVQKPVFDNFGEALKAEPTDVAVYGDKSCATIVESSGIYYRFVAKYDNKAKKLWKEGQEKEPADQIWPDQEFIDYVCKLPVKRDVEFADQPLEQAELDQLIGKTVAEVKKNGYQFTAAKYTEEPAEIACTLTKGYYDYTIILSESYDVYQEHDQKRKYDDLTIKGISLSENLFSSKAWGM